MGLKLTDPPPVPAMVTQRTAVGPGSPFPVREITVVGVSGSLEGMEIEALLTPTDCGENCTWNVHDVEEYIVEGGSVFPEQRSFFRLKFAAFEPVIAMVPRVRSDVPSLSIVKISPMMC